MRQPDNGRIGLIGYGAMARALTNELEGHPNGPRVCACLLHPDSPRPVPEGVELCHDAEALIAAGPDLVVECAGQGAISGHVPDILRAGIDTVIVSIGALCDDALREELGTAAAWGKARLLPVAGAVGGLDLLRAARLAGLDEVIYRGIKPPMAWAGSPAETVLDLASLAQAEAFFEGTAREAARRFPKNANVAAAIALSGIGLDATRVELVADPAATENRHSILARGAFGTLNLDVANRPLPENPKTSHLAVLSAAEAVLSYFLSVHGVGLGEF